MPIVIIDGPVIEAGESLSEGVDCTEGRIIKITYPAGWSLADLTFQTSSDGGGYNDIVKPDGREVICTVVPGAAVIGLELVTGFIKFRSGSREHPIAQPERRQFAIALDTGPEVSLPGGGDFTVRLEHRFAGST